MKKLITVFSFIVASFFVNAVVGVSDSFAASCTCKAGKVFPLITAFLVPQDKVTEAEKMCTLNKGTFVASTVVCTNATVVLPASDAASCAANQDPSKIKEAFGLGTLASQIQDKGALAGSLASLIEVESITCTFDATGTAISQMPPSPPTATPVTGGGSTPSAANGSATAPTAPATTPSAPNPTDAGGGLLPARTGKCPEDYQNPGTFTPLGQGCKDGYERDYALDDIKSLLATIGNFMISVSGAIVLFCFVLGGFFWIASAGNQKMVDRGKGLISGAVIGTIIMVSAYTLVTFAVRTLVGSDTYSPAAQGPGAESDPTQGSSIIKGNVTQIPATYTQQGLCETLVDNKGTCQKANTCQTNYSLTGVCSAIPNQAGEECCMPIKQGSQSTGCAKIGGTCQEKTKPCGGVMASGLCSGGASVQCCIPI